MKLLTDESIEVRNIILVNENMAMVQYKGKEPSTLSTENVAIATFTTAHARLRLYEAMEKIVEDDASQLLYFDTDSVFYVKRPTLPDPSCGNYLGDLTDEYPNKKITGFSSGGPKNYTYRLSDGSHVTKVKGFTLNFRNSEIITPSLVDEMVRNPDGRKIAVPNARKITRNQEHGIVTRPESKHYRVVYTKRVLLDDGTTLPYGYKENRRRRLSVDVYEEEEEEDEDEPVSKKARD